MGKTKLSVDEVHDIIDDMVPFFDPEEYNIASCNCHHFTDMLCDRLVHRHIPGYINNLPRFIKYFKAFIPEDVLKWKDEREDEPEERHQILASKVTEEMKEEWERMFECPLGQNAQAAIYGPPVPTWTSSLGMTPSSLELAESLVNPDVQSVVQKLALKSREKESTLSASCNETTSSKSPPSPRKREEVMLVVETSRDPSPTHTSPRRKKASDCSLHTSREDSRDGKRRPRTPSPGNKKKKRMSQDDGLFSDDASPEDSERKSRRPSRRRTSDPELSKSIRRYVDPEILIEQSEEKSIEGNLSRNPEECLTESQPEYSLKRAIGRRRVRMISRENSLTREREKDKNSDMLSPAVTPPPPEKTRVLSWFGRRSDEPKSPMSKSRSSPSPSRNYPHDATLQGRASFQLLNKIIGDTEEQMKALQGQLSQLKELQARQEDNFGNFLTGEPLSMDILSQSAEGYQLSLHFCLLQQQVSQLSASLIRSQLVSLQSPLDEKTVKAEYQSVTDKIDQMKLAIPSGKKPPKKRATIQESLARGRSERSIKDLQPMEQEVMHLSMMLHLPQFQDVFVSDF
eukprot:TRINITY_DN7436_c0_g1_i1.p1 TRINITY_DN7436_c0_g1~~TRINITY_DN7436_c0_g1_i1.p1  ORF type:complete len:571 (-),score=113.54 TRINITY_DN7436_c0_g1_i1:97-1809(-)